MSKIKKLTIALGMTGYLLTSANAAGIMGFVTDVASSVAADTIKKLFQKDGKIDISNSDFINNVKINNATIVMSNVGIEIKGKDIKISNSDFINDVQAQNADVWFSNLGISIDSGEIKIANSDFINTVIADNATLVAANAGIKITGK